MVTQTDLIIFAGLPLSVAFCVRWLGAADGKLPAAQTNESLEPGSTEKGQNGFGENLALAASLLLVILIADLSEARRLFYLTNRSEVFSIADWGLGFGQKLLRPQEIGTWYVWTVLLGLFMHLVGHLFWTAQKPLPSKKGIQSRATLLAPLVVTGGLLGYFLSHTIYWQSWSSWQLIFYFTILWGGWFTVLSTRQTARGNQRVLGAFANGYVFACIAFALATTGSLRLGLYSLSFGCAVAGYSLANAVLRRGWHPFQTAESESLVVGITLFHGFFLSGLPLWALISLSLATLAIGIATLRGKPRRNDVLCVAILIATATSSILLVQFIRSIKGASGASSYYH